MDLEWLTYGSGGCSDISLLPWGVYELDLNQEYEWKLKWGTAIYKNFSEFPEQSIQ